MKYLIILFCTIGITPSFGQNMNADKIIDRCIEVHGGQKYDNAQFSFDFRNHHYVYRRNDGQFQYERIREEEGIRDILDNGGLKRFKGEMKVKLSQKDERKFTNSVNSVHYFAFLPYFLNDEAVNKKYLGDVTIKNSEYFKVKVTFDKDGGGDDYEDEYIYWINKESFTMDYLAYSFHVDGGGVRFRSSFNRRIIEGIVFQDYINYKHSKDTPVEGLDDLFVKDQLEEVSRIELKNVRAIPKKS